MVHIRAGLVVVGLILLAYGGWLLLHTQRPAQLAQATTWALAAVVLHDALIAPLALTLGWIGGRALPRTVARAATVAFVLAGTLTIVAIPVLDGYAAGGANHTLLDRDYVGGWILVIALILLTTAVGAAASGLVHRFDRSHRSRGRMAHGPRPRRR
ncbi:hypothetical protein [Nocardioides sp. Iso805N]|uniref:hypothetical protein n=1 Tax=Nocardioides sp. Iso805N TaxID=1283287 RepID=UPI00036CE1B4|nr:hypothetical protein [Nocardioides sp. Iso805N]